MSNAMRDRKGNSLSPEPCALIPQLPAASEAQDGPVENSANPETAARRTMRCGVAS